MIRVLVSEGADNLSLIKRTSPYSIISNEESFLLSVGWNEIPDLKYGFYIDFLTFDNQFIEKVEFCDYDTSNIVYMNLMFANISMSSIDLSKFNTSNVIDMRCMFGNCDKLVELDLSNFDTRRVDYTYYMFARCKSLVSLDLSNFDASNFKYFESMFYGCENLRYIKCKKDFKEWCLMHQDEIDLPDLMRECGSGMWDIID